METVYSCQVKSIYLKWRKPFALFSLNVWNQHEISNILKKKMSLIGQVFLKLLTPKVLFI